MEEKLGRSKTLQRKMPKKQKINILWFTKDLRTRDSESLYNIMREDLPFLAVYVFDAEFFGQKQFGFQKIGKFRTQFLLESVEGLKKNLAKQNIPFLIRYGKTEDIFQEISERFEVVKIFYQEEWTKEETEIQAKIRKTIPAAIWEKSYSQFLVHPLFVFKTLDKIPMVFTTFRQKIEKNLLIRPEFESENMVYDKGDIVVESDKISLQSSGFEDFKKDKEALFLFPAVKMQL